MGKELDMNQKDIVARANLIIIKGLFRQMRTVMQTDPKYESYSKTALVVRDDVLYEHLGMDRSRYSSIINGAKKVTQNAINKIPKNNPLTAFSDIEIRKVWHSLHKVLAGEHFLQLSDKYPMTTKDITFDSNFEEKVKNAISGALENNRKDCSALELGGHTIEAWCFKWMVAIIDEAARNLEQSPDYIFKYKVRTFATLRTEEIDACSFATLKEYYARISEIYNDMTIIYKYKSLGKDEQE